MYLSFHIEEWHLVFLANTAHGCLVRVLRTVFFQTVFYCPRLRFVASAGRIKPLEMRSSHLRISAILRMAMGLERILPPQACTELPFHC
jgi:hypothetical protein